MENKVYIVRCPDYDHVDAKIPELLEMMGGMSQFVKPGEKIVLKPNLLTAAQPEKAVTTHPSIVAAVARLAKNAGAAPLIADSPGASPHTENTLKKVYRNCEMNRVAEETGIDLNFETGSQTVSFPAGNLIKRFEIITPILAANGVLNLCKLKTHSFLSMTGAVKNNFGVIPGLAKPAYHAKLHDPTHFANMCLDLSLFVAPRLSLMDAVVGMEGNGPNNGVPKHVGLLLAATNPLSLDVVAGEIMGLQREQNFILIEAEKRGLVPNRLEQVELVGLDPSQLRIPDFALPATLGGRDSILLALLTPIFKNGFTVQPRIIKDKCVACGVCRDACPVQVIAMVENDHKYAQIDPKHCIRCYCCHEMCPEDAIELRQGALYRLFNR